MKKKTLITTLIVTGVFVSGLVRSVRGQGVSRTEMVTASQDKLLSRYDKSDRLYKRLEIIEVKIVSYFHRRKIGQAIVEKDFIRYQFDTETKELIEETKQWRSGLPAQLPPVIPQLQAESMVDGVVDLARLYFISPESHVYPISPTPKNPCWVVWSVAGDRMIITIIDAITGQELGYGIPPPATGYSLSGPRPEDANVCSDPWTDWYTNARDWFNSMGYPTTAHEFPRTATIQSYVQSDDTAMFYELAHGGSWSFRNWCPEYTTAGDVETWLASYANMPFTFIGSCNGMCDTTDNHLSHEFRKGSHRGTATVGYCGMSSVAGCKADCWPDSVDWQDELFSWMNAGSAVGTAFNMANLAYPDCAGTNNCTRFAGHFGLFVVPVVTRSLCGNVYDGFKGPLTLNSRDHYIRCDITVPSGERLTIDPGVKVAFLNNSRITSHGTLNANGATGQTRFVSEEDNRKGMQFTGQLRIMNGGEIKIYE